MKSGFVNAMSPEIAIDIAIAPERELKRLEADPSEDIGGRVRSRLTDDPWIPINPAFTRNIGSDAAPLRVENSDGSTNLIFEDHLPFFKALGVGDPPKISYSFMGGTTFEESSAEEPRLLRAFDIVLKQERIGSTTDWDVGVGAGNETIANFSVGYTNLNYRRRSYLVTDPNYIPPTPDDDETRLRGNWEDTPIDNLKVATVYLLSPPGATPGSNPDPSWTPYYRNDVFWNLNHTANLVPVRENHKPLQMIFPPLVGGVANKIFDAFIATSNDAYSNSLAYLNNFQIKPGRFWTT